jgi:DNA-binding GntR family transcriptional regulator
MSSLSRQQQLRDMAYEQLKEAIVVLELPPGAPLREVSLATQLGVSKTPIREALVRLANEGLVTIEPYRGAFASLPTGIERREVYDLRALLEGDCARRAVETMSGANKKKLTASAQAGEAALAEGDVKALVRHFEEFDVLIRAEAGGPRVASLLSNLADHIRRIGNLTVGIPGRLETSVEQHLGIAKAIEVGDGRQAEELVRAHVRSVLDDLLADEEVWPDPEATGTARPALEATGTARPALEATGTARPALQSTGRARPALKATGTARPALKATGTVRREDRHG